MITCYICQSITEAGESHHIWPQAYGGKDGPEVDLCANCHSLVHKQALNIAGRYTNKKQLFPDSQWIRAKPIVAMIVRAMRDNRNSPSFHMPARIQINTTKGVLQILHNLKKEANYSSLNDFINAIINSYIRAKMPLLATEGGQPSMAKKANQQPEDNS